jgi:thymidylate synthase (FAD)
VASYSQQSQRYVRFGSGEDFITPPNVAADPEARAVFLEAMENARRSYDRLVALGQAAGRTNEAVCEDARFVLPNAAETKIVVTMNARELRHFFSLRCCRRAQWEINRLAWSMRHLAASSAPLLFEGTGPGCMTDSCPEGKMTCGQPWTDEEVLALDLVRSVAKQG